MQCNTVLISSARTVGLPFTNHLWAHVLSLVFGLTSMFPMWLYHVICNVFPVYVRESLTIFCIGPTGDHLLCHHSTSYVRDPKSKYFPVRMRVHVCNHKSIIQSSTCKMNEQLNIIWNLLSRVCEYFPTV